MKHAKNRPPSAAHRWLSCPGSVQILQTYSNGDSDASLRGEASHELLMAGIIFGVVPNHPDIEVAYSAMFALEKVLETLDAYKAKGKNVFLFTEETLEIPQTGEIGTSDIIFVTPDTIHIIDYKHGYVPVELRMNPQLLLYLLGAIHKFGTRKHYKISIIQPNYVHIDGMYRTQDVSNEDLEWFENEVRYAMINTDVKAGKHCKTSYCPHRGACPVFLAWSQENLRLAWYPGEIMGMDDDTLSQALDQSDVLTGYRNNLRAEGMRRILNMGRQIDGYKLVRDKKDRQFADDTARDKVFAALVEMGASPDELYERVPISVAGAERIIKRICKPNGRDAWVNAWKYVCPEDRLLPRNHSLTLEKAIDGRKSYKRGIEFTPLKDPASVDATIEQAPQATKLGDLSWPTPLQTGNQYLTSL